MRLADFLQRTLAVIISVWLVAVCTQRLVGHWYRTEAAGVLQRWSFGEPIRSIDIDYATPSYKKALSWFDNPEWLFELASIELAYVLNRIESMGIGKVGVHADSEQRRQGLLESKAISPMAKQTLQEAVDTFERGLRLSPTDGNAWYHLALSRFLLLPQNERVNLALRNSLILAPGDNSLLMERLSLAFRNWSHLSPEVRFLLRPQYEYAIKLDASRLSVLAAHAGIFDEVLNSLPASSRLRLDPLQIDLK